MRVVHNRRSLPRSFKARHPDGKSIVAECDIFPRPSGRLAAKLLVFTSPTSMRAFWRKAISGDLGKHCTGAVNALATERTRITPGKPDVSRTCVDPRYFCVIGLCLGHLGMEIIAHEAVHAAFAYRKRVTRNVWGDIGDFDEEQIAYPTGAIARAINVFVHEKGLYER